MQKQVSPDFKSIPYETIAAELTARFVHTPRSRLEGFSVEEPMSQAAGYLRGRNFDFGAVFNGDEVVGRVSLDSLLQSDGGQVADFMQSLSSAFVVAGDSPIREVMRWLRDDPWLLVIDMNEIAGLVTPSDLNRQAARTYFYMLVSDFEIKLADSIRREFSDPAEALEHLGEQQRQKIRHSQSAAESRNIDSDYISYMDLSDLVNIAAKTPSLRDGFGYPSRSSWEGAVNSIVDVRHRIMHPVRPLLDDASELDRLIDLEVRLHELLD